MSTEQEDSKNKFRVTMVRWSVDDRHVITAVSDFSLKVWNSHNGQLVHVLQVSLVKFLRYFSRHSSSALPLIVDDFIFPSHDKSIICFAYI